MAKPEHDFTASADFFGKVANTDVEKRTSTINASDVYAFLEKQHGLNRSAVDQFYAALTDVNGGLVVLNGRLTAEDVNTARRAGVNDLDSITHKLTATTPDGKIDVSTKARRDFDVPVRPGETPPATPEVSTHYGYTRFTHTLNKSGLPKVAVSTAADLVRAALGA